MSATSINCFNLQLLQPESPNELLKRLVSEDTWNEDLQKTLHKEVDDNFTEYIAFVGCSKTMTLEEVVRVYMRSLVIKNFEKISTIVHQILDAILQNKGYPKKKKIVSTTSKCFFGRETQTNELKVAFWLWKSYITEEELETIKTQIKDNIDEAFTLARDEKAVWKRVFHKQPKCQPISAEYPESSFYDKLNSKLKWFQVEIPSHKELAGILVEEYMLVEKEYDTLHELE